MITFERCLSRCTICWLSTELSQHYRHLTGKYGQKIFYLKVGLGSQWLSELELSRNWTENHLLLVISLLLYPLSWVLNRHWSQQWGLVDFSVYLQACINSAFLQEKPRGLTDLPILIQWVGRELGIKPISWHHFPGTQAFTLQCLDWKPRIHLREFDQKTYEGWFWNHRSIEKVIKMYNIW